jgi:hypothetical protein
MAGMLDPRYHCTKCDKDIDLDDQAAALIHDTPVDIGSLDPVGSVRDERYAHRAHADFWLSPGYRLVCEGKLRDLMK